MTRISRNAFINQLRHGVDLKPGSYLKKRILVQDVGGPGFTPETYADISRM